ncbi:PaaI family thioesterase [Nitrospirillum amazonense]|uniref:Thioesterase superfamily protein n=1 Tax=Nitrospirillum amazonense TaxID=28077 RepID=A0A560KA00_9PROT|nr:PaaI family thioesterase [Nitrospirillum amazonense]MDG3441348.1 PaaI family thioesterase [Nitrospirillum amazonense]TWB80163.1 thioesterase superfamily protein [Nitrospirillum amazonense]
MMADGGVVETSTEGWALCPVTPGFIAHIGPFWEGRPARGGGDGGWVRAFVADERHLAGTGQIHTSVLSSFAELVCLRAISDEGVPEGEAVLLNLTLNHLGSGPRGTLVQGEARLIRRNWSQLVTEVRVHDGDRPLVAGTALWSLAGA